MDIAKAMDMDITEEELVQGLTDVAEELKAKSEEAAKKIGLEENNLEQVAGGEGDAALRGCSSTYVPGEWCWIDDSCAWAISSYENGSDSWEDSPPRQHVGSAGRRRGIYVREPGGMGNHRIMPGRPSAVRPPDRKAGCSGAASPEPEL